MKKQTVRGLKKKVWKEFATYIKLRDCLAMTGQPEFGICYTCGKPQHVSELQAGHFISGRHNAGLFSEKGVHAQCRKCNFDGGHVLEYRRRIVFQYGEGVDVALEEEARQTKKFTIEELQGLLEKYQQKTRDLKCG